MNLKRKISELLPKLAKRTIDNIKSQIRSRRFNSAPFGAPLSPRTIANRKRHGRNHTTALLDEGKFLGGLQHKKTAYGVEVFSTGRTERQQRIFVAGTARVPKRDPFVKDLPVARGGTIEQHLIYIAGKEIEHYVDSELSRLKGVS